MLCVIHVCQSKMQFCFVTNFSKSKNTKRINSFDFSLFAVGSYLRQRWHGRNFTDSHGRWSYGMSDAPTLKEFIVRLCRHCLQEK